MCLYGSRISSRSFRFSTPTAAFLFTAMKTEEIFEDASIPYIVDKRTGKEFPLPAVIPAKGNITLFAPNNWPPRDEDIRGITRGDFRYFPVPCIPGLVMAAREGKLSGPAIVNAYASEITGIMITGDAVLMEKEQ